MKQNKSYTGLDYARLVAAFLIIAIHTSPLSSYTVLGDFILTRIIARVAVPFFLMTSGYFLLSRYHRDAAALKNFVRKTAIIYAVAILIYIPINLYSGYFAMDNLLPNILKDIVFDGTMYHLWYLPAAILGAVIAWYLVAKAGFRKALLITEALYIIGLFGDSYYGIIEGIPTVKGFYGLLFQISDYTRNGIFFAPVFLVLGGMLADRRRRQSLSGSLLGFAASLGLLLTEALTLHYFGVQRHDSMYVMLIPCMYFLFHALTCVKGTRVKWLRNTALVVYIIHPMVIVVVRLMAKIIHMEAIFIENSLVNYLVVSMVSLIGALILNFLWDKWKQQKAGLSCQEPEGMDRAWIELDLTNLKHNVSVLRQTMPQKCQLMAVVKAEAYGHGAYEIAFCINQIGVKAFAVATIDEGIRLRGYGITGEILILGYTNPGRAKELHAYDLTQSLIDGAYALQLNAQGVKVKVHIKIDSGMHRLGFDTAKTEKIAAVYQMSNLMIKGIYTHLCVADSQREADIAYTKEQIRSFYQVIDTIRAQGLFIPRLHIQSSYGLFNYPELSCDYVRAGVALYGVLSSAKDKPRLALDLRPVLSLKARVILLRDIKCGESIGYGRCFAPDRDSKLAVVSIGYADGLPRNLSGGHAEVLIQGQRVPVIGRICMDQLIVDVTDCNEAAVGDVATIIGKDGTQCIRAEEVADNAESITNELLSRMGGRLSVITK